MEKKRIIGIILLCIFNPVTIFLGSSLIQWILAINDVASSVGSLISYATGLCYLLMFILVPLGIYLTIDFSKAPALTEKNEEYAGFWKRNAACLIDRISFYFIIPIFVSLFTYFVHGQTLGKMAMGVKIIDLSTGTKPSGLKLFARPFAKILSSLFYIGFFWIGWDKRKQGWHDKICNTSVVEVRSYHQAWTWFANIPLLFIIFGVIGTIAFISLQGYTQDAKDSLRLSTIASLSRATEISNLENGSFPTTKEEVLGLFSQYQYPLPNADNDRCYFYAINEDATKYLFLVSGEGQDENYNYDLMSKGNYIELQNTLSGAFVNGAYLSCDNNDQRLINLSQ